MGGGACAASWRSPRLTWPRIALALYVAVNAGVILYIARPDPTSGDWQLWKALPAALPNQIYNTSTDIPFVWSVPAAWIMAAVAMLGYWWWFAAHFVALWYLRSSPLILVLTAGFWGFWVDAAQGNIFTFVFVAGYLALRGSKSAGLVYFALCALAPRPVQLPLALWLFWKTPELRVPSLAMAILVGALSAGHLSQWIVTALAYDAPFNASPTHFIGGLWFVVGLPLALWLTWRGRVGLAGLAMSPYIMPYYLLFGLLELSPPGSADLGSAAGSRSRLPRGADA